MTVSASAPQTTFAHELGHACGLNDLYKEFYPCGGLVSEDKVTPLNWSGGEGTGYYSPTLFYCDLTYRCLMDTARPSATLASCSLRLELYADAGKTNFFSSTVLAGETVHVEGRYPSASVGAETVVWEWTDSQQQTQQLCQRFTVFSLRIFGDINLDGTVDTADCALQAPLPGHGWAMPSVPGVLRPLQMQTDNQLPGRFTLGLSGTPGAFRVWRTAQPGTNDTPLLVCGRDVGKSAAL